MSGLGHVKSKGCWKLCKHATWPWGLLDYWLGPAKGMACWLGWVLDIRALECPT